MAASIDVQKGTEKSGWLLNSSERNVGFSPSVYWDANRTYVRALDSTNRRTVGMSFSDDDYALIAAAENVPDNIQGFEYEELFTFLLGTRIAQYSWHANSYVEKDDTTYSKMVYDISDTLYTSLYFEGRIYNVQLGVSYLQNWVEERSDLAKSASKVFSAFADFNDLFSKFSFLRIELEKAEIHRTADYSRNDSAGVITGPSTQTELFEETLTDLSAKVMMERGWFVGAEYLEYAVGFSNSAKQIEYITVDPSFNIQNYMLIGGYDEISYARRYERDLSRFYFQGNVGFGISLYALSNTVSTQVKSETGKTINSRWSFVLDGEMNGGYI